MSKKIESIRELYDTLRPSHTTHANGQVLTTEFCVNLSDIFTKLIKDAARCNSYSSDVYYDLQRIEETVRNYRNFAEVEPIFIGFRRHGVDGNTFILSRIEGNPYAVHNEYFALYSVMIEQKQDEPGWATVVFNEYWM